MRGVILLAIVGFALAAAEAGKSRAGVQLANIGDFPFLAALITTTDSITYQHRCGGTILTIRSVLTGGRCMEDQVPNNWRFRVGSKLYSSGGTVHQVTKIIEHYNYDPWSQGWDIAIVHTSDAIVTGGNVQLGQFSGPNYNLADYQPVQTVGWGRINIPMWNPGQYEELRTLQQEVLPASVCQYHNNMEGFGLQPFQICSGFSDPDDLVNAIDKCLGEPGTPLLHHGIVVGIRSYAVGCSDKEKPTTNTRVSSFIDWISENA